MKKRDLFLTGFLLLLTGILIGFLISLLRSGLMTDDLAEVNVTEIQRSSQPIFSHEELELIDSRFVFQNIAREVTPTVVYIETTVQLSSDDLEGEQSGGRLWDRFIQRHTRSVGSGVIISSNGYILTNHHVIEQASRNGISVTLSDKRNYQARVVGYDTSTDLAVLKIDAQDLPSAVLGNSDNLTVGEWVLAIGNPFRLQSTVTAGIVSALERDVDIIRDRMRIETFIQTDAAINRGNSGGALVNTSGELVGINTAIATQSGNYQGYGFAVPSNLALKVASDLIEYGEIQRGMLGIVIESVNQSIARDLNMNQIEGVLVVDIDREGAAWQAGLRRNDVILEVSSREVNEANQLQRVVAMYSPGDRISIKVWRDGELHELESELYQMEIEESGLLEFDEEELIPEEYFEEF